jgi:hypothetical protein
MPLLDLPVVLPGKGHQCGDGLFGSITSYWESVRRRVKCDPWTGKHPLDLEPEFRRRGYQTFSGQMTVDVLKAVTGMGIPIGCLIQSEGCGHWVGVRGVQRGRVYYMDPDDGNRSLPIAEWEAVWFDRDHHGTEYRNHGLAVWC